MALTSGLRSPEGGNGSIRVLLAAKSHRQRNLMGHNPWDREESDMTE